MAGGGRSSAWTPSIPPFRVSFIGGGARWYTSFLKSDWLLLDHDEEYAEWAVTYFSKTPFTDAGMDVYARSPSLSEAKVAEIVDRMSDNGFLGKQARTLYSPVHESR